MSETPVWDQLCKEWNVPPASGIRGLITVIEGRCQPPTMDQPALEQGVDVLDHLPAVIDSSAVVRSTRKPRRPAQAAIVK